MTTLKECIAVSERLLVLMEQDRADIRTCIRGDLLTQYMDSATKAAELAESIKTHLVLLEQDLKEISML